MFWDDLFWELEKVGFMVEEGISGIVRGVGDIASEIGWEIENKVTESVQEVHDTIDLLTTDPEIEGKKRGYEKAAREYEPILLDLKNKYTKIKKILEDENSDKQKQFDELIVILQELEAENKMLKQIVKSKADVCRAKGYHIPLDIARNGEASIVNPGVVNYKIPTMLLFNAWKDIQLKKRNEAEIAGYMKARDDYVTKVNKLKSDMENVTKDLKGKLNEKVAIIGRVIEEIARKKEENVELKLIGEL